MAIWPSYPCRNPACKSHGQPHPNCKCGPPMAEGGEASAYCSESRAHKKDCEYFADGREAQGFDWGSVPDAPKEQAPAQPQDKGFDWNTLPSAPGEDVHEKYGGLGQQLLTGVEGAAQGVAGPLATAAELGLSKLGVPGLEAQDIAARQAENPVVHGLGQAAGLAGGLFTGMSEANLAAKAAGKLIPEATTFLGQVGSAALKGAIETGIIQGGDEISKAMLGQADPEAPVSSALAHMGATALYGGAISGIFGAIKPAASKAAALLEKADNDKINTQIRSLAAGFGAASKGFEGNAKEFKDLTKYMGARPSVVEGLMAEPEVHEASFNNGMKMYKHLLGKGVETAVESAGSTFGLPGYTVAKHAAPYIEKILGKQASKYAGPVLLKAISTGEGINNTVDLLKWARTVGRGQAAITNGVEGLFKYGGQQVYDGAVSDQQRERLKQFIENGEQNQMLQQPQPETPQGFAEGGAVQQPMIPQANAVAQQYPNQDMMVQAAKGRINNYLNSVRPQPAPGRLPYDPEVKDKQKERSYNKAIDLAIKPLSILNHVKDGTLSTDQMKHFVGMYPEIHSYLSKKLTEKITNHQIDEEKPSYKIRQTLSMFLGTPLDSTMTPAAIQGAQSVYAQKKAAVQQEGAQKSSKKGSQALTKMPQSYKTSGQALETRQQREK